MQYTVRVIGAGSSGLQRQGISKAEAACGRAGAWRYACGSCVIFKRQGTIFDQGSSMLYGFGERGFNTHRFVLNCLEEPIDVNRHEMRYTVDFKGKAIRFCPDA